MVFTEFTCLPGQWPICMGYYILVPLVKSFAMSKSTSIVLGSHFEQFIKAELQTGRYGSASEVIRAGLRMLEIEKARIESIRQALVIGEESGKPSAFDLVEFKLRMKNKHVNDA